MLAKKESINTQFYASEFRVLAGSLATYGAVCLPNFTVLFELLADITANSAEVKHKIPVINFFPLLQPILAA